MKIYQNIVNYFHLHRNWKRAKGWRCACPWWMANLRKKLIKLPKQKRIFAVLWKRSESKDSLKCWCHGTRSMDSRQCMYYASPQNLISNFFSVTLSPPLAVTLFLSLSPHSPHQCPFSRWVFFLRWPLFANTFFLFLFLFAHFYFFWWKGDKTFSPCRSIKLCFCVFYFYLFAHFSLSFFFTLLLFLCARAQHTKQCSNNWLRWHETEYSHTRMAIRLAPKRTWSHLEGIFGNVPCMRILTIGTCYSKRHQLLSGFNWKGKMCLLPLPLLLLAGMLALVCIRCLFIATHPF